MDRAIDNTLENSPSLTDARMQSIIPQLNEFFNDSTRSPEILNAIFEQYYPSLSIHESIICIYSNSLSKPIICKVLDNTIKYLHLNNVENSYKVNEQTENCDLLHNAIRNNDEHIFQFLLKCGYNPNSFLSDHTTPLSIAVVNNNIHPTKRLEYIQSLITHGANAIIRDDVNDSPFRRLCGMESNYPIVYTFFRDYLLSIHPNDVQLEFNAGLKNAFFRWNVSVVTDLLEHGAIFHPLKKVDAFLYFLTGMSSRVFKQRRPISFIDPFILCLIQFILHNHLCENYSGCIEMFIKIIYIPVICFEANNNPINHSSMIILKKFFFFSFYYGYFKKSAAIQIRNKYLPEILTTTVQNPVPQIIRQQVVDILNQYFDESILKYHQNPVSLRILSIRKVRQSITKLNQKNLERLNISQYLKNLILPKD